MKALSVRQPWASLIESGEKTIECRTWASKYRGPLLICASSYKFRTDDGVLLPAGVMVCTVDLLEIRPMTPDDLWAAVMEDYEGDLTPLKAWVLGNVKPVEFVPVKGRLHLFEVDDDLIKYIDDGQEYSLPK